MIHSEQLNELAGALCKAQGEFEAVAKDAKNPFFKSYYADLPAIVQAASPILTANGLAVYQGLGHDDRGDTLTTMVLHSSGQYIGDTMHLRPVKDDPQAQGSATTYGRRYAYMAALGLVADVDDDGNAASEGTRAKPKAAKPKPAAEPRNVQDRPAPAAPPEVDGGTVDKILKACKAAGKSRDWTALKLVEITGRDVPTVGAGDDVAPDVARALKAATLDEAAQLYKAATGSDLFEAAA